MKYAEVSDFYQCYQYIISLPMPYVTTWPDIAFTNTTQEIGCMYHHYAANSKTTRNFLNISTRTSLQSCIHMKRLLGKTLTRLSSMVSCFLGQVSQKHTRTKYISKWISEFLWQTCLMICFMLYKWRMPSLNMTRRHPFESIAFDIPWPKT